MARPKKAVAQSGAYRIVEKEGKFILYHGDSVRQVFGSLDKAVEYLGWIGK